MNALLTGYQVSQTAWLFLSSMLIIAAFYRFRRVWSLRNFDLLMLLSLSPGMLMVRQQEGASLGYLFLFLSTAFWSVRLFMDRYFTKRSRIDPNLNTPGMFFLGVCAFAFLMTEAITRPAPPGSVTTVNKAEQMLNTIAPGNSKAIKKSLPKSENSSDAKIETSESVEAGPTAPLVAIPVVMTTSRLVRFGIVEETAARVLAILAHIAIVFGLYWIGCHHFHDKTQGIAMAALYLLMPCTSFVVCEVNQVLPCAFIIWAIACYTRPLLAGVLMGFACGSMFFPVFVLPIWASFFGWKRSLRFFLGVGIVAVILAGGIALISADSYAFTQQTINRIDFRLLSFEAGPAEQGFWNSVHPAYRIPVMVVFALLVITLTFWPWKKSLEVLLSYNAAIIVFTQFWYPQLGGAYVLWYLPLLILVVFRPRLLARCDYSKQQIQQQSSRPDAKVPPARSSAGGSATQPFYR
ncbi:MAG: hypothetical protein JKY95_02830 [Planctomycetaceae bacterium]|nr:hypothetical protein [Planctomycetaceae bacterium]